jgi:ribosome modulation factor
MPPRISRRQRRSAQASEPTMMQQWLPYMMMQQLQQSLRAPLIREGRESTALQNRIGRQHQIDQAVAQREFLQSQSEEEANRQWFERAEDRGYTEGIRGDIREYEAGLLTDRQKYEADLLTDRSTREDKLRANRLASEASVRREVREARIEEEGSRRKFEVNVRDRQQYMEMGESIYTNAFNAVTPPMQDNPQELEAHWTNIREQVQTLAEDHPDALALFDALVLTQGKSPDERNIVTQALQQVGADDISSEDDYYTVLGRVGAAINLPDLPQAAVTVIEHEAAKDAYEQSTLPPALRDHPAAGWAGEAKRDPVPTVAYQGTTADDTGIQLGDRPRLTGPPSEPELGSVTEAVLAATKPAIQGELDLAGRQSQRALEDAAALESQGQTPRDVQGWIIDDMKGLVLPRGTQTYGFEFPEEGGAGTKVWNKPVWEGDWQIPKDRLEDILLMDPSTAQMLETARTPSPQSQAAAQQVINVLNAQMREQGGDGFSPLALPPGDPAAEFDPTTQSYFTRMWQQAPETEEDSFNQSLQLRNYLDNWRQQDTPSSSALSQLLQLREFMIRHEGEEGGSAFAIADAFHSNMEGKGDRVGPGWTEDMVDTLIDRVGEMGKVPWQTLSPDDQRALAGVSAFLNQTNTSLFTADLLPPGETEAGVPIRREPEVPTLTRQGFGGLERMGGAFDFVTGDEGQALLGYAGGQRVDPSEWPIMDRSLLRSMQEANEELPPAFNQFFASPTTALGEEKVIDPDALFTGPSSTGAQYNPPGTFSPGFQSGEVTPEMMERAFGGLKSTTIEQDPNRPPGFLRRLTEDRSGIKMGDIKEAVRKYPPSGQQHGLHIPDQTFGGLPTYPPSKDKGDMPTWGTVSGNLESWRPFRGNITETARSGRGGGPGGGLAPPILNPADKAFEEQALKQRTQVGGQVERPSRRFQPEIGGPPVGAPVTQESRNLLRNLPTLLAAQGIPGGTGGAQQPGPPGGVPTVAQQPEPPTPLPTAVQQTGLPDLPQPDSALSAIPDVVRSTFPGADAPTAEAIGTLLKSIADTESNASWSDEKRSAQESGAGAVGMFQMLPSSAEEYSGADPRDPHQALKAAGRMLLNLWGQKQVGDPTTYGAPYGITTARDSLAGWNWGPGHLTREGRSGWKPEETRNFIEKTMGRLTPEQEQLIDTYIQNIIRQGGEYREVST